MKQIQICFYGVLVTILVIRGVANEYAWYAPPLRTTKNASDSVTTQATSFTDSWSSLDSRPLPKWYDDAKFGIFVHWGVYSVPGVSSEWFWNHWKENWTDVLEFMGKNYPPGFQYADFGTQFKAEFFNASLWADLVSRSGAKYFVFTSKHHDGFANWNTSYAWNWNSVALGPHRDIVGELAAAFRNHSNVAFGLYFSLYEWFNPLYLKDKANNFTTKYFIETTVKPQLKELINTYKPEIVWSDGDWEATDEYWDSRKFLAWLYNDSPVKSSVVVNDRWGRGCGCNHGDVYNCADRYNPGVLQNHKWENAMTISKISWGIVRNSHIKDYYTVKELIKELVSTVSCGGNLLMNISPASDGTIPVIFQERLQQMGDWLRVNGEAIYGSTPWKAQNDTSNHNVWYTKKDSYVYAIALEWPSSGKLVLDAPIPSQDTQVTMLGLNRLFKWGLEQQHQSAKSTMFKNDDKNIQRMYIEVPPIAVSKLPSLWAWVFRLTNVS